MDGRNKYSGSIIDTQSVEPATEFTDPGAVDYAAVEVPNAEWHETRTFITFIFPTYEEEHMRGIAAGIRKVIAAYAA